MNKEQAIDELKELQLKDDPESAHGRADEILCELLDSLGHQDVVNEFDKIKKWYS